MTKILITGSRDWAPTVEALGVLFRAIDKHLELSWDAPEMIVGMSPEGGVDTFAYAYGMGCGYGVIPMPAEPSNGRFCVPRDFAIRNQKMVDEGPDVVLAFFAEDAKNKGTQMTVDMAEKANIPVERYYYG